MVAWLSLISGGSDADQAKDGDHVDHSARYRRTAEYAQILKKTWLEQRPFDHSGEFYQIEQAYAEVRCTQHPRISLYGGGGSDAAIETLAPNVDTFMQGEPLAETAAFMERVRAAAGDNEIKFSVQPGPFSVEPKKKPGNALVKFWWISNVAWGVATCALPRMSAHSACYRLPGRKKSTIPACIQPRRSVWGKGQLHGAGRTPETVAQAMVAYYDIGATSLLIRGYDPLEDAREYGEELIPRVRELVAERDKQTDQKERRQ